MEPFDPRRRESLVRICQQRGSAEAGETLVSIDEFFSGNSDLGSIGSNLTGHPGVEVFASVLMAIQERADVQTVLIGVTDLNDDGPDSWPFSDRVYIITSALMTEVKAWVQRLYPDEVEEPVPTMIPLGLPEFQIGQKLYLVWWD